MMVGRNMTEDPQKRDFQETIKTSSAEYLRACPST